MGYNKMATLFIFWCLFIIGCSVDSKKPTTNINIKVPENHTLVLIGASWCGPCNKMKKDLIRYKIHYHYIEYSKENPLIESLNISVLPTYILVNNKSKVVKKQSGYRDINSIITFLSE